MESEVKVFNDEDLLNEIQLRPGYVSHFGSIANPQEFQTTNIIDQVNAEVNKTYDGIWRYKPVDALTFCQKFLKKDLKEKQKKLVLAMCGEDPFNMVPPYHEADIIWGMRSGKNYVSEALFIYKAYLLQCLVDPQGYFGFSPDRTIDLINVTVINERQARQVFFNNACNTLKSCIDPETGLNWFQSRTGMDIRDGKDIKKKEMDLPHNIRLCSFNTEADSFQGYNVYFWVADEISRANTKPRYEKAKTQLKTIVANCTATFKKYGSGAMITYPDNDTIDYGWERYKANRSRDGFYCDCAKTLEVREDLTQADLQQIFDDDPEFAEVAYNCNVKAPESGFFSAHPERIDEMFDPNLKTVIQYGRGITERIIKENGRETMRRRYTAIHFSDVVVDRLVKVDPLNNSLRLRTVEDLTEHYRILCMRDDEQKLEELKALKHRNRIMEGSYNQRGDFVGKGRGNFEKIIGDNRIRFISCDPALSGDTYAMVGGYCEQVTEDNKMFQEVSARYDIRSIPVIDIIIEFRPERDPVTGTKVPVDYVNVQNTIQSLKLVFPNLQKISFDHYQSEQAKQQLEASGLQADVNFFGNKLQYKLYTHLRRVIYSGMIRCMPYPLLQKELRQLLDINHVKVDHPPSGSKDLGDSLAMTVKLITDTDVDASGYDLL